MRFILSASQITPAFVREACSLLRQSIIHVEQDDIDFDEEELQGDRPRLPAGQGQDDQEFNMIDENVDAEDLAALDQIESNYLESMNEGESMVAQAGSIPQPSGRIAGSSASSGAPYHDSDTAAPPVVQPRRKLKITHDKYVSLQTLIVMHLSSLERTTGKGADRDDLIDWYLEQKEGEIEDVDELEYEKELIGKVLNKLVKVGLIHSSFWTDI